MGAGVSASKAALAKIQEQSKGQVVHMRRPCSPHPRGGRPNGRRRVLTSRRCVQPSAARCAWQIHDLYDYEAQPFLLGYQNEDKIKKQGLKKTDFEFKQVIGVSMFGHISLAKHKVT